MLPVTRPSTAATILRPGRPSREAVVAAAVRLPALYDSPGLPGSGSRGRETKSLRALRPAGRPATQACDTRPAESRRKRAAVAAESYPARAPGTGNPPSIAAGRATQSRRTGTRPAETRRERDDDDVQTPGDGGTSPGPEASRALPGAAPPAPTVGQRHPGLSQKNASARNRNGSEHSAPSPAGRTSPPTAERTDGPGRRGEEWRRRRLATPAGRCVRPRRTDLPVERLSLNRSQ